MLATYYLLWAISIALCLLSIFFGFLAGSIGLLQLLLGVLIRERKFIQSACVKVAIAVFCWVVLHFSKLTLANLEEQKHDTFISNND